MWTDECNFDGDRVLDLLNGVDLPLYVDKVKQLTVNILQDFKGRYPKKAKALEAAGIDATLLDLLLRQKQLRWVVQHIAALVTHNAIGCSLARVR